MIEYNNLREWQKQAYTKWEENHKKGLIVVSVGCGKTLFALYCLQELEKKENDNKNMQKL